MALKQYECPNCGSRLQVSVDGKIGLCPACDSRFLIEDDVIRHRIEGTVTVDGLTSRKQLHKRAEQFMQLGQYADAAALFHEIIDKHDAHDSDAWWGLARISAQDFKDSERRITREQLGRNYLRAIEYATPEKREAYESTIRDHERLYASIVAEREAKAQAERERQKAEADRRRAEQARADAEAKRREEERRRIEQEQNAKRAAARRVRRRRAYRVLLVLLAMALCAGTYAWFVAIPNAKYQAAMTLMEQGDYAQARESFERLSGHKDSTQRAEECAALEALAAGDVNGVRATIENLRQNGDETVVRRIQNAAVEAVSNWRQSGLSPQTVLEFLKAGAVLNPDGALDAEAIFVEAHVQLAGGDSLLAWRTEDIDGNGEAELIALGEDLSIRAYRMASLQNLEIAINLESQSEALAAFGQDMESADPDTAISCYLRAVEVQDTPENRVRAGGAYMRRASRFSDAGNMAAALADAQAAVDISDTQENFSRLYDIAVSASQSGTDLFGGIELWETFCARYASQIDRYAMGGQADAQSGNLCLLYANALAVDGDISCADWYVSAYGFGVSVLKDVDASAAQFPLDGDRLALRFVALEIAAEVDEDLSARQETLVSEINAALAQWQGSLPDFQNVFHVLKKAEAAGLSIDAQAAEAAYQGAALQQISAQEQIQATAFHDWDGDGWDEAIVLTASGSAALYASDGSAWSQSSERALPAMSNPTLKIVESAAPVVLAQDGAARAFAALTVENGKLQLECAYAEIYNFALSGDEITFSTALEGSIARYADMRYALDTPHAAPVLDRVDWQKENYPLPQQPDAAVLRFLETLCYDIPEETALLTNAEAPVVAGMDYTAAALAETPAPFSPTQPRCAVCLWDTGGAYAIVEAYYEAEIGAIARYFAVVPADGGWKIAGASDACGQITTGTGDHAIAPLALNAAVEGALNQREEQTWRVLLPYPAEVSLAWEASEVDGSYFLSLASDEKGVIAYRLNGGVSQRTNALFLAPGVYMLTLTAGQSALDRFDLTLSAVRNDNIELEPNDGIPEATRIATGLEISASLQAETDVDLYCFALEKPGRTRISLTGGQAVDAYALSLASAIDARALQTAQAGGEVETEEIYLDAGEYILQIAPGEAWTSEPYAFCVEHTEDALVERERNDVPDAATPISQNTSVTGRFNSLDDVDYYAFALEQPMQVLLQLDFSAQAGNREGLALTLYAGDAFVFGADVLESQSQIRLPRLVLPAGQYRLCIENRRMAAADYVLRLETSIPEGATLESEPNDAPDSATTAPLNAPVLGALLPRANGEDIDTYAFTLEEPGAAMLGFSFALPLDERAAGSYYILTLADEGHSTIYSETISATNGKEAVEYASPTVYLDAGTYYVQVTQGRNAWAGGYTLRLDYEVRADAEGEYNDTLETATPVPTGTPIRGSFLHSADVDWLRVDLDVPSVAQLQFAFTPLEENERVYTLTLTDGEQEYLQAHVRGRESNYVSTPVCLPAGTYYICLENPYFVRQEYALTVVCAAAEAVEEEPNDTLAESTPLLQGRVYSGICSSRQDVDTYLLTVSPGAAPTLSFAFDPFGGEEAIYTLHIEQNGRALWSMPVSAASGGFTAVVQLPVGDYYLSVTPEDWTAAVYTITVS